MNKKPLLILLFLLGLTSCTSIIGKVISQTSVAVATEVEVTASNTPIISSTSTYTPPIATQGISVSSTPKPTEDVSHQRVYNPDEWELIFDKDMPWQCEVNSNGDLWLRLERGEIAFYNGVEWKIFTGLDYGFEEFPDDIKIAPDGSVWVSGTQTLSRYKDGLWKVFPIPKAPVVNGLIHLAIDPSGIVWVGIYGSTYSLKSFDGKQWKEYIISDTGTSVWDLLFTPDGNLWVSTFGSSPLGRFDGTSWKLFPKSDIYLEYVLESPTIVDITSDSHGNLYASSENGNLITRISPDNVITKITIDDNLEIIDLFPTLLYVDQQNTLWAYACLEGRTDTCLSYYQDGEWYSFIYLPFTHVTYIDELSDGTLLVSTEKGLYRYTGAR